MADDWSAALDPEAIAAVLTDTAFGHAWSLHLALATALVAVVAFGPRARWGSTALASAALLASLGLVGHATMQIGVEGVVHRANHAVHLLAAGAWIGGLVPFALCLRAYERDDLRRDAVQAMAAFSFWGQLIVASDRSHGRRQHRPDLTSPPAPTDHAISRASGRETRHRRDHDFARARQSLCSRSADSRRAQMRWRPYAPRASRRSRWAALSSLSSACLRCSIPREAQ